MAPKFAPKVWKRPYTSIYNDNYRYGNSLYSEQIGDIERKYNEAIANTRFRGDRPDLGLSSYANSQLIGQSEVAKDRTAAAHDNYSAEKVRSISMSRVNSYLEDRDRKLAHSPSFDTYSSSRALDRVSSEIEESRLRRSASRRNLRSSRPESLYNTFESNVVNGTGDGPSQTFWMERWYRNSMRSVAHDLYPTSLLRTMVPVQNLQKDVEELKMGYTNATEKVKQESTYAKNKINQDVADLLIAIDDQERQIQNLQKQLRTQAKQVANISLELEASQRQYTDVNETLNDGNRKALNMVHEIEEMRSNLEKVTTTSNTATTATTAKKSKKARVVTTQATSCKLVEAN